MIEIIQVVLGTNQGYWFIANIALVILVAFLLVRRNGVNVENEKIYLGTIVMLLISFLLSLLFYSSEEAIALFTFASTITSIILSVIAIIMTISSESKNEIAKNLLIKTEKDIEAASTSLNETVKKIEAFNPEKLEKSVASLESSLADALTRLESIKDTSEEIKDSVKGFSTSDISGTSSGWTNSEETI